MNNTMVEDENKIINKTYAIDISLSPNFIFRDSRKYFISNFWVLSNVSSFQKFQRPEVKVDIILQIKNNRS